MEEREKYERAERRVKQLKSFYSHLVTYIGGMVVLFFVDYTDRGGTWWFYWPLLGWGVAVAIHAFETFGTGWEKKKIRQLLEKEEREEQ